MNAYAWICLVLCAVVCVAPVIGQEVFTWTGADNNNWTNADNWSSAEPGYEDEYPGEDGDDDVVTIPDGLNSNKYPVKYNTTGLTIGRLIIEPDVDQTEVPVELEFKSDGNPHVLKIAPDQSVGMAANVWPLDMGVDTVLKLQSKSELWFVTDAEMYLAANSALQFADGTGANAPKLVIADGQTVTLQGLGTLAGISEAKITGQVANPDGVEVFVLGNTDGNPPKVRGTVTIDTILYSHGEVHTGLDATTHGTITLVCHPKGGTGSWWVDGGESGELAALILNASLAGAGVMTVFNFGTLTVNYPFSIMELVDNAEEEFTLKRGAKVQISAGVLFEMERFKSGPAHCPVPVE